MFMGNAGFGSANGSPEVMELLELKDKKLKLIVFRGNYITKKYQKDCMFFTIVIISCALILLTFSLGLIKTMLMIETIKVEVVLVQGNHSLN